MSKAFDIDGARAGAVVGFFCYKAGEPISVLKALKLIYISQRESLRRFGEPIFAEHFANTPVGPMPINIWKGICNGGLDLSSMIGLQARIRSPKDDLPALSDGDFDMLEEVWDEFGGMDDLELTDYTCSESCPEGEKIVGQVRKVTLRQILQGVGYPPDVAQGVEEHIQMQSRLKQQFMPGVYGHA